MLGDRIEIEDGGPVDGPGYQLRASNVYVPIGDHYAPEWIEGTFDGDAAGPTLDWRCEVRDGAPRIVVLAFRSSSVEGEIRQKHPREVELAALETIYAAYAVKLNTDGTLEFGVDAEGSPRRAASAAIRAARTNRKLTPAFLREIAEVYREHIATAPTKAIESRYFVSPSQASNYVKAARKAGELPPTDPGRKKA